MALKVVGSNPITHPIYAGMAELADALDLGSSVFDVGVQVLFPAPNYKDSISNDCSLKLSLFLFVYLV